ncbi:hypothetical protein BSKO_01746 [Bryopsis sp. KO-2023]|nr:hypothetical protein BSKO_01746 [Bryopsis sp. KO-2023]
MGAQNSKAVDAERGGSGRSVTSLMTGETFQIHGLHHAGLLCENLELSMQFYSDFLGLRLNPDRPDARLDFRGAWFWVGTEMIHLMEVPNPDPKEGRPEEGGRDKHICIAVESLQPLIDKLNDANLVFTRSLSGRKAIFVRDPDMNCLEFVETGAWRG